MINKIILFFIKKVAQNFEVDIKQYREFNDIRLKDKKGNNYAFAIKKIIKQK